jgi:hypothetical protein
MRSNRRVFRAFDKLGVYPKGAIYVRFGSGIFLFVVSVVLALRGLYKLFKYKAYRRLLLYVSFLTSIPALYFWYVFSDTNNDFLTNIRSLPDSFRIPIIVGIAVFTIIYVISGFIVNSSVEKIEKKRREEERKRRENYKSSVDVHYDTFL